MLNLQEARRNLDNILDDELRTQCFALIRNLVRLVPKISIDEFQWRAGKMMKTKAQRDCLILYTLALYSEAYSPYTSHRSSIEIADYLDYMPASPTHVSKRSSISTSTSMSNPEFRLAAAEFFLPDVVFLTARIDIHLSEESLDSADAEVAELMVDACKTFAKNMLTAMITKKESYKVRDNSFQYAFGFPVPDPLLRNSNNIVDHTQESFIDVTDEDDNFVPSYKPSATTAQHQTAFAYSCGTRNRSSDKLTVKLLYETLKENPRIVGLDSIQGINLFRLGLELEDNT